MLPMGTSVDTLDMNHATLRPIRRGVGGGATVEIVYSDNNVSGEIRAPGRTIPVSVDLEAPILGGGPGVEVTIAALPLEVGYQATYRVLDLMSGQVRPMKLEVTGTETTECPAGSFDVFVVQVTPLDDNDAGSGTLKVMMDAPHHVVSGESKLPAAAGGGMASMELVTVEGGSQ